MKSNYVSAIAEIDKAISATVALMVSKDDEDTKLLKGGINDLLDERLRLMKIRDILPNEAPSDKPNARRDTIPDPSKYHLN